MIRIVLLTLMIAWCSCVRLHGQDDTTCCEGLSVVTDSTSLLADYLQRLSGLVAQRDSIGSQVVYSAPNPYYYKIMSSPTLYQSPLHQMMTKSDSLSGDPQLQKLYNMNLSLAKLYVQNPWLVQQTETNIRNAGKFRDDVKEKIETQEKLADRVSLSNLLPHVDEEIVVRTRRPKFWKFTGNAALQFTQNHFSENWYQGGENNYSGNTNINLKLDFNNQKKLTFTALLEFQLGFQTSESDEKRVFRPTSNRICFTTNFGFKAYKTLYYSAQVRIQTQVVPNFKANTEVVTTDIFSPMDVTIAPGFKYDIAYGKKKRFKGFLNVAPLAYNIKYCDRDNLVTNFGVKKNHNSAHSFGPNVTLNTTYQVCNQITWSSNIYWFSNLHFTKIEWTNTINFAVSKLISAQVYLYPRFDDSAEKYRNEKGQFIMFKEYFSMGLNYSF